MSTPTSRSVALVAILVLALGSTASAQLTKAQQACVNTQNASWLKLGAVLAKTSAGCLQDFRKGKITTDVELCVASNADGLVNASDKAEDAYDERCVGLDGDGQPKLPGVFVTDPDTLVHASLIEWGRALRAAHGVAVMAEVQTDADDRSVARCQSSVEKTLTKCAAVFRKSFNACKKTGLAGKAPFVAPITTPAELAACIGDDLPKNAIAKACGDKMSQTLAKQCVDKGADLGVAFAHCGSTDPATVQSCLVVALRRALSESLEGTDALPDVCDSVDDGTTNGSCTPLEVLVPAYANPCCGDGPAMWADLATAAAGPVRVNVILNPASGPGAGPEIDPNYVNDGPVGPLLDVRAAGAKIYGYVSTSFATRPPQDAKSDVDLYYTPSFWRGAGVQVDGIFLDEMSSDLPDVGYYQELRDYVHAKAVGARVIANPGQPATQDSSGGASGYTVMDYATAADVLVTFEGTGADYRFTYQSPAWVDALPAAHFAHLVHSETDAGDMGTDLDFGRLRKVGMIYVTDDLLSPNPWDTLATYWLSELDSLRRLP